jgi:hypothetical protein
MLTLQQLTDEQLISIARGTNTAKRLYLVETSDNDGWQSNHYISMDSLKEAKFFASEYVLRIKGGTWKVNNVTYRGIDN